MASSQSSKSSRSSRFAQSSKSSKSSLSSTSSSSVSSNSSSVSSVSSNSSSDSSFSSESSLETTYFFSQFLGNSIRIDEECFSFTREIFERRDIRNLLGVVSGFTDCQECFKSSSSSSSQSSSSSSQTPAFADCGTPNGDPTLFSTFSWTDADVNKTWLGCTWTNGETKEVFANTYNKYYAATLFPNTTGIPYSGLELWKKRNTALDLLSMYANPLRLFQFTANNPPTTPNAFDYKKWQYQELDLKYSAGNRRFWRNQFYFTYGGGAPTGATNKVYNSVGTPVVVTGAPNPGVFDINQGRLSDNMLNGEMLYANGLRFKWSKGNNW